MLKWLQSSTGGATAQIRVPWFSSTLMDRHTYIEPFDVSCDLCHSVLKQLSVHSKALYRHLMGWSFWLMHVVLKHHIEMCENKQIRYDATCRRGIQFITKEFFGKALQKHITGAAYAGTTTIPPQTVRPHRMAVYHKQYIYSKQATLLRLLLKGNYLFLVLSITWCVRAVKGMPHSKWVI